MDETTFDPQSDEDDGMDDLFFDNAPDVITQHVEAPPELLRRLEELELGGCCQNIAWSKQGAIAYVSQNRSAVKVSPYPLETPPRLKVLETQGFHGDSEIINVSWDTSGHYLATVDVRGRICIFRMFGALDRLSIVGKHVPTKADICNGVVGLNWIGSSYRPEPKVCLDAKYENGGWRYNSASSGLNGPLHPMNEREALFFVTRDGVLHLMVAQDQMDHDRNLFLEVSSTLSQAASTDLLLTHASFTPEQDHCMLLATCDISLSLRLYRISVDWHYDVPANRGIPAGFQLSPSIKSLQLDVCACRPNPYDDEHNQGRPQLVHLLVLPSLPEPLVEQRLPIEVVAVFSRTHSSSRVVRWALQDIPDQLHAAFQSITNGASSKKAATSSSSHTLRRQDDFYLPHTILSLRASNPLATILFLRADGGVETRRRDNFESNENVVSNLNFRNFANAGFEFASNIKGTDAALSPNGCAMMVKTYDAELDEDILVTRYMDLQNESMRSSAPAVLAMTFASACFQDWPMDDILSLTRHCYQQDGFSINDLLKEFFLASQAIDTVNRLDPAKLTSHQSFHRSLSAAYDLQRTVTNDLESVRTARLLLSVRHVGFALFLACDSSKRSDVTQSEMPSQVLPLVGWYMKIATYLVSSMMDYRRPVDIADRDQDKPIEIASTASVRILLSTCGRRTLRLVHKYLDFLIRHIRAEAFKDGPPPHAVRQGWQDLGHEILNCPVGINHLDKYLASIDVAISTVSESNGADEEKMLEIERDLIINGSIPTMFQEVVEKMSGLFLEAMVDQLADPSEVFFAQDFWLWHHNDPGDEKNDDDTRYAIDIVKKTPLIAAAAIKKCMRCGSCAEAPFKGLQMPRWVVEAGKMCICGGSWVTLETNGQ